MRSGKEIVLDLKRSIEQDREIRKQFGIPEDAFSTKLDESN
jgi:hypothetical protein